MNSVLWGLRVLGHGVKDADPFASPPTHLSHGIEVSSAGALQFKMCICEASAYRASCIY